MTEINKRILTSIFLFVVVFIAFYNKFVLFFCLIFFFFQVFFEFFNILKKIIKKKNQLFIYLQFILVFLLYLFINIWIILSKNTIEDKIYLVFIICICVSTDIGGLLFGKIFKGKKLTKISPNKTYSGVYGSYILSFILGYLFFINFFNLDILLIFILIISSISQLGDLFISLLKRKAKIKDTSNILPGHGGLLDRFDGMIFAIPIGIIISKLL